MPMARAMAGTTSAESVIVPSGTNHTPSGYSSASPAATWSARRVLPVPPGPVSVSRRVRLEEGPGLVQLQLPPDEGGQLRRQVVGTGVERADRREVGGQAVDHELGDALRAQVLEPVRPQWTQRQAGRESPLDQLRRRLRQQHLPAVPGRGHARGAVHIVADVGPVGIELAHAGVEAHPHPDRGAVRPRLRRQRALHVGHRRDGRARVLERREEAVPLDLVLDPAVRGQGRADDLPVPRKDRPPRGRAEALDEPRRPLDVGEQER